MLRFLPGNRSRVQEKALPSVAKIPLKRIRLLDKPLIYPLIFLVSFVILFLGMDRGFDFYDEGLILVGAMRVAAGQVPHRDFYANYGPGQFYTLAWLFDLFGRSILVERIYDLALRAAIVTVTYGITAAYCRRWIAICTTIVCGFWLFSAGLPSIAYPIIPILLLTLIGSMLLLPIFRGEVRTWRMLAAGALAGLVALFRYDVGFALAFVHFCTVTTAAFLRLGENGKETADPSTTLRSGRDDNFVLGKLAVSPVDTSGEWFNEFVISTGAQRSGEICGFFPVLAKTLFPYLVGVLFVFLPPALLYLAIAPIHPFLHDIILYPTKYYARARRLPFPGVRWRSLENMAVYLPIAVAALCLYSVITAKGRGETPATGTDSIGRSQSWTGFFVLFGLLSTVFYFKGIIRISIGQILLSLIPAVIALAVLYEYSSRGDRVLHRIVQWTMALSIFTATWSALKEMRVLYLGHESVLEEVLSPPGPAFLRAETNWCGVPNPLHTGLCFLVDPAHAEIISYISDHTSPGERIFIGLNRHDRILMNDLLTYFVSDRLPATRWSHFDPDLQTRADIQTEMINELDRQAVRYVILEGQYDSLVQASNDSSKSSGVTLLDDYIRGNYHQVESIGSLSVWLRNGS
jgi:hypothetical protein